MVQNCADEADEQMGVALDILHQHGITEHILSDCEDDDHDILPNTHFLHPSSDALCPDSEFSSGNSNSDSIDYPITSYETHGVDFVGAAVHDDVPWVGIEVNDERVLSATGDTIKARLVGESRR